MTLIRVVDWKKPEDSVRLFVGVLTFMESPEGGSPDGVVDKQTGSKDVVALTATVYHVRRGRSGFVMVNRLIAQQPL